MTGNIFTSGRISNGHLPEAPTEYTRIARLRYDNGYTSFVEALDSERSLFIAELTCVNTQNNESQ